MTAMVPNREYESFGGELTGRSRPTQFYPTPRYLAVPPSKRRERPFEGREEK